MKDSQMGYARSYDTIKRYVAAIRKATPKAYMVLHSLHEAQVQLGTFLLISTKSFFYSTNY
ncbi:hypothetical protein RDV78_03900 [Bacillota bacterium LX-D]|nr:hypothetical protein [Bacillota bacterium LX-D]